MKSKIIIKYGLCALIVFTFLMPLNLIATSHMLNGDQIDQEQTTYSTSNWCLFWDDNNDCVVAQSFKPTLNILTRIRLVIKAEGNPTGAMSVSIRKEKDGEDLATDTYPVSNVTSTWDWIEFDIQDLHVEPEKSYYIVWKPSPGSDNDNTIALGGSTSKTYDRGAFWYYEGTTGWLKEAGYKDLAFKTYGLNGPSVEITSPATGESVSELITINGTASHPDGEVEKIEIKIDEQGWQTADGLNSWSYSLDTCQVGNGEHTISARSYDGNVYSAVDSVDVIVNNAELDVKSIHGGFGDISADIKNIGQINAENVVWSISVEGLIRSIKTTGYFSSIDHSNNITISTDQFIVMLGPINVEIVIEANNAKKVSLENSGFAFGPFINVE